MAEKDLGCAKIVFIRLCGCISICVDELRRDARRTDFVNYL